MRSLACALLLVSCSLLACSDPAGPVPDGAVGADAAPDARSDAAGSDATPGTDAEVPADAAPLDATHLSFAAPLPGEVADNPVTFRVLAGATIARVAYDADGWALGESTDAAAGFGITYPFSQLGPRQTTARGYDASEALVAQATMTVRVKTPADPAAEAAVLAELQAGARYGEPTPQDAEGQGIWPEDGQTDHRSETAYPPFVLGPRRQTDSLVRQLYGLLPETVRTSTAFVIADRIAQQPEAYLAYLRSRAAVVIVGNFVGIGSATTDQQWFLDRHALELDLADLTVALAHALGLEVIGVHYTMGDSISTYAPTVKARLEAELAARLSTRGLNWLITGISWGADEAVPMAFAARLPVTPIRVRYATPDCAHHYDGGKTSAEVLEAKLPELGLVIDEAAWAFEVLVLTNVEGEDGIFPDAAAQATLDSATLAPYLAYTPAQRARLVIVDGRMFNGAWNADGAPAHCDLLAYGSWGTFANKVGATLATAKLVHLAQSPDAARQLYLEAVAHDVYANGYQDGRTAFTPALAAAGITFSHFAGYDTVEDVTTVFGVVNDHVSASMEDHFAATTCLDVATLRLTPQLWRTFESEVHLLPGLDGRLGRAGIHRTDLEAAVFDPTFTGDVERFDLQDLVDEAL